MKQAWSYAFCTPAGWQTTNSYTVHEADNQYDNKETDSDNKIQLKKPEILNRQRKYFQFDVKTKVSCGNADIGNAPITDQIV